MKVNVTISRLAQDRIRVCLTKPRPWNANASQDRSISEVEKMLVRLGLDGSGVKRSLSEIETWKPHELMNLGDMEVDSEIIRGYGFRLPDGEL